MDIIITLIGFYAIVNLFWLIHGGIINRPRDSRIGAGTILLTAMTLILVLIIAFISAHSWGRSGPGW